MRELAFGLVMILVCSSCSVQIGLNGTSSIQACARLDALVRFISEEDSGLTYFELKDRRQALIEDFQVAADGSGNGELRRVAEQVQMNDDLIVSILEQDGLPPPPDTTESPEFLAAVEDNIATMEEARSTCLDILQ